VTTLMLGDALAALRQEQVAAIDLNPGQPAPPKGARGTSATTIRALLAEPTPSAPASRGRGRLDLITSGIAHNGHQVLADEEYGKLFEVLAARYPLTLADPGASAVARVLAVADQLVLVAPASPDAPRAVAMTLEWLDAHRYRKLGANAVAVFNGVSKRSMAHVEQAESVVRGMSRAIVRVPWDDHLGEPPAEQGIRESSLPSAPESRLALLRPQVQHAYLALAGVLVSSLTSSDTAGPGTAR
jgi:MinD-like ATPase involved in chromosome partitioning or flagellar assembly